MRFAALFPMLAARQAERLFRAGDFDLLYGYEVHGVLAQRRSESKHPLPLVARFQGTIMHPYLDRPHSLAAQVRGGARPQDAGRPLHHDGRRHAGRRGAAAPEPGLGRQGAASGATASTWAACALRRRTRPRRRPGAARRSATDEFVLVTATRLARWKRVDRAIDAVAHAARSRASPLDCSSSATARSARTCRAGAQPRPAGPRDFCRRRAAGRGAALPLGRRRLSLRERALQRRQPAARGDARRAAASLTLDEGDTRDLIRDGETGILLHSGEPQAIADATGETLARPAQATTPGPDGAASGRALLLELGPAPGRGGGRRGGTDRDAAPTERQPGPAMTTPRRRPRGGRPVGRLPAQRQPGFHQHRGQLRPRVHRRGAHGARPRRRGSAASRRCTALP